MEKNKQLKAKRTNNYQYNKKLITFAHFLRKDITKAEACLWKYALSARKMKGYQFRRQRPVLNYIADFMCKELMLIPTDEPYLCVKGKRCLKSGVSSIIIGINF